uniref:Uncharacterized protein n=1 Tax=Romanomermis culicivorax TaxID=13658 RepID=A0A915J5X4_ROMCU
MDFDRETCVCAKDYCNRERPDVVESSRVECNMSVKMNALFFKVDKQLGKCRGEHCFDVSMTSHDSSFQYAAQGCMSFVEGRQKHEELNDEGCVDFKSSVINMKACFLTEKDTSEKNGGRKKEKSQAVE